MRQRQTLVTSTRNNLLRFCREFHRDANRFQRIARCILESINRENDI